MRFGKVFCHVAACAVTIIGLTSTARADFASYGWRTTEADASSSTSASLATLGLSDCHQPVGGACTTSNADVTFIAPALNFGPTSSNTFGGFIGANYFLSSPPVYHNGASATTPLDPSLWEFTGVGAFVNGVTTFTHDDGLTVYIGGSPVINSPGKTSATTDTYTGPTGNFSFTAVYAECCGAPAVLTSNLVEVVPEPTSVLLLATVLFGVGGLLRKKFHQV